MAEIAKTSNQNYLPVQAYFNVDGTFNTFIGQGQPFYATVNPVQSGLTITNSTLNNSPIGSITPSTGVFTNITTITGQVTTTPSGNTDLANKFYVDTVAQGLGPKAACQVGTTANITLSGLQTIDGYTTVAGDRVLVKNQTSSQFNGIYVASASAWTRAIDMDVWSEVPGAYTVLLNGGQANTGWVSTATQTGTIDVTAMPWVQFSGTGAYFAGTGLNLASNTFSIANTTVTVGSYGSASNTLSATVNQQGQLTALSAQAIAITNTQVSGLGTLSTQNANAVAITGGSINGTTIGVTTASTGAFSTLSATGQITSTVTTGSAPFVVSSTTAVANLSIGGNAATATSATSATTATTATNLAGGANGSLPYQTGSGATTFLSAGTNGYVLTLASGVPTWAASTGGVTSFNAGTTGLLPNSNTTGAITLSGTLNVANGGTGVVASSGANSVMLRDANQNTSVNNLFLGFQTVVSAGTTTTLTVASPANYYVTGSTSQTFQLPNATTLVNGAEFTFNNNSSASTVSINNGAVSPTLIASVGSGGFVIITLLDNSTQAGTWDKHYQAPSNVNWSTNTFDYAGSFTSGTWNGNNIALNRGGTNASLTAVAGGAVYSTGTALAITAAGTTGYVLTSNGSSAPTWQAATGGLTISSVTGATTYYPAMATALGATSSEYIDTSNLTFTSGVLSSTFSGNISNGTASHTSITGTGVITLNTSTNNQSYTTTGAGTITIGSGTTGTINNMSIGATTASTGAFTTVSATGQITSTLATGTAPFVVSSTTPVTNLSIGGNAGTATTATTATNSVVSTTSSASTFYPTLVSATSGASLGLNGATTLSFVPSTGVLSATGYTGAWQGSTIGATYGGTGQSSYATGDIIYASATNTLSKLTAGTNGYVLTLASGVPTWAASSGGVSSFQTSLSGLTPNTSSTGAITLAGTLGATSGGTGLTAVGTSGNVLTSNGTTWVSQAPTVATASYTRTSFTATVGQTTFSVTYTAPYIAVYQNGALLNSTDYTATNGTSVVLTIGASTGDIIETIAYNATSLVSAAGSNTQVQYNNSGSLGASSGFTFTGNDLNIPFGTSNSATSSAKIALALSMIA